jgi:hypothetical protein
VNGQRAGHLTAVDTTKTVKKDGGCWPSGSHTVYWRRWRSTSSLLPVLHSQADLFCSSAAVRIPATRRSNNSGSRQSRRYRNPRTLARVQRPRRCEETDEQHPDFGLRGREVLSFTPSKLHLDRISIDLYDFQEGS